MDNIELNFRQEDRPSVAIALTRLADGEAAAYADDEIDENRLYNDVTYGISINIEDAAAVDSVEMTLNKKIVPIELIRENDNISIVPTAADKRIFLDCVGGVKIKCSIRDASLNKTAYVSKSVRIMRRNDAANRSVVSMLDFIYKHGERYLYENRKYLLTNTAAKRGHQNSIEVKLDILRRTLGTYKQCYGYFTKSPKKKLINADIVGSFEKLGTVTVKTIRYIVSHPEELVRVNHGTGINLDKQYFQPRNTLVSTTVFSDDVYENQVVAGFLKTVNLELKKLDKQINTLLSSLYADKLDTEYIDSMACIYESRKETLEKYLDSVKDLRAEFETMYFNYSRILTVSNFDVVALPKYTRVFQSIKDYHLIYNQILEWFSYGDYNIEKYDLLFMPNSTFELYEYFCLVKINDCLEKHLNYKLDRGYPFKYPEGMYYTNTRHNNTFRFVNKHDPSVTITVYFQPAVLGEGAGENGLLLFRNTQYSVIKPDTDGEDGDDQGGYGNFYNPDFVFKITQNNTIRYFILDAKFSTPDTIVKRRLPELVFKYWFSISPINPADTVSGICFICGKGEGGDKTENIYNTPNAPRADIRPSAKIVTLNGAVVDDYGQITSLLQEYISG